MRGWRGKNKNDLLCYLSKRYEVYILKLKCKYNDTKALQNEFCKAFYIIYTEGAVSTPTPQPNHPAPPKSSLANVFSTPSPPSVT
jgi:hypothetical protein